MLSVVKPLVPLIASCFILLLGSGLTNTFLPLRMEINGLDTDTIGLLITFYFIGMLLGAMYSKHLIKRVGHIRLFSGSLAIMAACILICALDSNIILWSLARAATGFCIACAYTTMESWFGDSATKETRGRILAIYNATILLGLFGGQFFIGFYDPGESGLFIISGIIFCAAILPVALSENTGPQVTEVVPMSLLDIFKISPLGVVSCFTAGITYSAVMGLLPVVAQHYGFAGFTLSTYVGIAILGAFFLQFPIGYLSDRLDRRSILLIILMVSAATDIGITLLNPEQGLIPLFIATTITSGIISCIYPISMSQTFDQLKKSQMLAAMGSMIMAFSIGGVVGPYSASIIMNMFDSTALFYFLAVVQVLLGFYVMYRMTVREALPVEEQDNFIMQSSAVTASVELDPRTEYIENTPSSAEAETALTVAETDPGAAVKLARAISMSNPVLGVEVAAAVASVEGIDVLKLYQVMSEIAPNQILDMTRAIVIEKPELAGELIKKLSGWYPEQVVPIAMEIGKVLPELRIEMAKIAVDTAPESADQIREYYTELLMEEQEAMRPADRYDFSEEDLEKVVAQLINVCSNK